MAWLSLMLDVDTGAAEALSDALLDGGAYSVSFDGVEAARCRMIALIDSHADANALLARAAAIAQLTATPDFKVARIDEEDWVRRSQAQFAPFAVGRLLHARASILGTGLHAAAIQHHRRRGRRRRISTHQLVLTKRLHFPRALGHPLAAHTLTQTLHMRRADRHLRQRFQILTRLLE